MKKSLLVLGAVVLGALTAHASDDLNGKDLVLLQDLPLHGMSDRDGCRIQYEVLDGIHSESQVFLKKGTVLVIDSNEKSYDSDSGYEYMPPVGSTGTTSVGVHTKSKVNELDWKGPRTVRLVLNCVTDWHLFGAVTKLAAKSPAHVISKFSDYVKLVDANSEEANPVPTAVVMNPPLCLSLNLDKITVPTVCQSTEGVVFKLLKQDEKGNRIWEDTKAHVLWSGIIDDKMLDRAIYESCKDFHGDMGDTEFVLPTNSDFETGIKDGFTEAIQDRGIDGYISATIPRPGTVSNTPGNIGEVKAYFFEPAINNIDEDVSGGAHEIRCISHVK